MVHFNQPNPKQKKKRKYIKNVIISIYTVSYNGIKMKFQCSKHKNSEWFPDLELIAHIFSI